MAKLLLTVEDRFIIEGRGIVVVPTIPYEQASRILERTNIHLHLPDGSIAVATIRCARWHQTPPPPPEMRGHVMCTVLGVEDVPIGTEIWLYEE
jgi:hypothetical protein